MVLAPESSAAAEPTPNTVASRLVRQMSAAELADSCREQTRRFLNDQTSDDAYGLELLRRAIGERDEIAWAAVVTQYRGLVIASVRRHPLAYVARDNEDDWVYRTFERFWRAIDATRLSNFADIAAVLGYLKMCVHSVLTDAVRSQHPERVTALTEALPAPGCGEEATEHVIGSVVGQQLWSAIRNELHDEAEECLAYLSFVRDLRPAEIHARRPDLFSTTADVYRVKRNIMERLRRSERIQSFIS